MKLDTYSLFDAMTNLSSMVDSLCELGDLFACELRTVSFNYMLFVDKLKTADYISLEGMNSSELEEQIRKVGEVIGRYGISNDTMNALCDEDAINVRFRKYGTPVVKVETDKYSFINWILKNNLDANHWETYIDSRKNLCLCHEIDRVEIQVTI